MPPEEYKGNVRSMLYEIVVEHPDELEWLLASDDDGAHFGRWGLDDEIADEGRELREELEKRGAVVQQISDTSLAWISILYDFVREGEPEDFPLRSILDEIDSDRNEHGEPYPDESRDPDGILNRMDELVEDAAEDRGETRPLTEDDDDL